MFFNQIESNYKYNHIGILNLLNFKKIETPIIWYGLSIIESIEFQFEVFKRANIKSFLSNAYDLLIQDKKQKRETLIKTLVQAGFFHKMDSGKFQIMKNRIIGKQVPIKFNQNITFQKQLEICCDIAVQLDVPLSPNLTKDEQKKAIDLTIDNFRKLIDLNQNRLILMPVVHGYNNKMLEYCIEKYEEILGKISLIGIGSLVPMIKNVNGTHKIGGKNKFIENLIYIRKRLPNSCIHAFGIGGTMSYLAFYCGIDSLDSTGWIQKSSYGIIQLPGVSDRFLTKKSHNRPYLTDREKDLFLKCKCDVCKKFLSYNDKKQAWKEKLKLFEQKNTEGRLIRAIHNLSVFNNELQLIKISIKKNNLDNFIENRLKFSKYYKLFKLLQKLKSDDKIQYIL